MTHRNTGFTDPLRTELLDYKLEPQSEGSWPGVALGEEGGGSVPLSGLMPQKEDD